MKQFKRIIAMIMTVAMCLGLAVSVGAQQPTESQSQTAGETDYYKITIKGGDIDKVTDVTQNDHQYYAYQIFTGDVNAGTNKDELSITGWGADVDGDALLAALKADNRFMVNKLDENGNPIPVTPATTPPTYEQVNAFADATGFAGVASVISKWKDGAKTGNESAENINRMTDYFAEVVAANLKGVPTAAELAADPQSQATQDWVAAHKLTFTPAVKDTEGNITTPAKYESPLLEEGYYLVRDEGPAKAEDDFISKNIIELLGGSVEIAPKGSIPQISKGVVDEDSNGIKPGTGENAPAVTDNSAAPYAPNNGTPNPPKQYQANDAVEANIGDTVWYTLKGTVSSMIQDYTTYKFKFVDLMSKGLDFGTDANADARDALSKTVAEINTAIANADAQKATADADLAALPGQLVSGAADRDAVYADDDNKISEKQTAVTTAEQAVATAQASIDSAPNQEALETAQAQLATAKANLATAQAELKAAQDTKAAHQKAFADADAAVTAAEAAQTKANKMKTDRDAAIDKAANDGDISTTELWKPESTSGAKDGGEAALLKEDRSTMDALNQSRYDEALAKVNQNTIDTMKNGTNMAVYLYNSSDELQGTIDPSCYEVKFTAGAGIDGGDKLEIIFEDLLTITDTDGNKKTVKAGDYLVAVYSAVVNEDAEIGNPGNTNEAYLEYSRDPDSDEEGQSKSTPNDAVVFTFELDINKIDKNSKIRLTDAGFFLFKEAGNIQVTNGNNTETKAARQYAKFIDNGDGTYTFDGWTAPIAKADTFNNAAYDAIIAAGATELLTKNNGRFEIKGLQSGDYGVIESTVPNGYDPSNRGKEFPMNIKAEFASLTATETVNCVNEFNPNYIKKDTYTTEEQTAGIDKLYVDAYGTPTNTKDAKVVNPDYGKSGATNSTDKWVTGLDQNGVPTGYTSTEDDALTKTMTLKTYKVNKLTLNGDATAGDSENGAAWIDVENSLELELPETGGIGTTLFYIIGGILVVGAAVVMITRKRVEG